MLKEADQTFDLGRPPDEPPTRFGDSWYQVLCIKAGAQLEAAAPYLASVHPAGLVEQVVQPAVTGKAKRRAQRRQRLKNGALP